MYGRENSANIAIYLENSVRGASLIRNTNRKSWVAERSVSVLMTLSDFERRGERGQNFLVNLHNYDRTV